MVASIDQLSCLVRKEALEDYETFLAVWEEKQPKQQMAQMKDKDEKSVSVDGAFEHFLQKRESGLLVDLL